MKPMTAFKAIAILHFACFILHSHGAVIEQVIVRQQWPWSTDVKVEYKVTGVTTPVNIAVRAFNGEEELPSANLEAAISGERYGIAEDGVGTFVIDPVKAFGTAKVALANFKVKLSLTPAAANANEVIYKVFDLSTGACQDITRADFYNGKVEDGDFVTDYTSLNSRALTPPSDMVGDVLIWTGVTNNVKYKTTHLVMRKIPAANKVWRMGAPTTEPGYLPSPETNHLVRLTSNYFIGVFEMTQKQYELLVKNNPTTSGTKDEVCPVCNLMFGRASADNNNSAWQAVKKIRTKTDNAAFCIPTEAQWEFACRGGFGTSLYSGKNVPNGGLSSGRDLDADAIAWFKGNSDGTYKKVGGKSPNAFGLYDMLGNVGEMVLDIFTENTAYVATFGAGWQPGDIVQDPSNPLDGSGYFVIRGGDCQKWPGYMRCATRLKGQNWVNIASFEGGMRMALMDDAE